MQIGTYLSGEGRFRLSEVFTAMSNSPNRCSILSHLKIVKIFYLCEESLYSSLFPYAAQSSFSPSAYIPLHVVLPLLPTSSGKCLDQYQNNKRSPKTKA